MPNDKLPAQVTDQADLPAVFTPPSSFEVVDRGAAETITFNGHGDFVVAIFEGLEEITTEDGEVLPLARLTGADAKPYAIFPNAVLLRALRKLEPGVWVRITYVGDVDTGKPSPLKTFVVERGA